MLSDQDRRALLALARQTLEAQLAGARREAPAPPASPALRQPCGCFVSLHRGRQLRGCIGTFQAHTPLLGTVAQMASAVLRDPRFLDCPVTAGELAHIDIEISVLTPLEKTADPMKDVELGRHGICIEGPYGSGCFLPQVATETGWSLEEFLGRCCAHKAGLPPDAWKWPETAVYRFEAEVFSEKDFAAGPGGSGQPTGK
ncbi:MAG: AmmeMemoRadiSam system protein A [Planctomycetes bacterium]|nr:AmmeMemoRadiSam system protein A [Planctomycetota bacterium]